MSGRIPALAFLLLLLAGCGATDHRVYRLPSACSDADDHAEAERCGAWLFDELMTGRLGVYEDEALGAYVAEVGHRVAAHAGREDVDWTFRVLDDPGVQAWAGPGGFVYVTRGLLAFLDSEAELAGVLAHEVGHVAAGHTDVLLDRLPESSVSGFDFATAFALGRDDEAQADQLAVRYGRAAGYDPRAVRSMLVALHQPGLLVAEPTWIDRHPPLAVRLALTARATDGQEGGRRGRERYLRAMEGLVVGPDPDRGVLVGERFVHARGGVSFAVPSGWEHSEWEVGTIRTQWFSAWSSDETLALIFLPLAHRHGEMIGAAVEAEMARSETRSVQIAGYPGLEGTLRTEDGREVHVDGPVGRLHVLTFEARDGFSYAVMMVGQPGAEAAATARYRELVRSFRAERSAPERPRRLARRRLDGPATLAELVAQGCARDSETKLVAMLNELDPDAALAPERTIKCLAP